MSKEKLPYKATYVGGKPGSVHKFIHYTGRKGTIYSFVHGEPVEVPKEVADQLLLGSEYTVTKIPVRQSSKAAANDTGEPVSEEANSSDPVAQEETDTTEKKSTRRRTVKPK